MRTVFRLLGIGWYVAFCILGGAFGGVWLDGRMDLSPLFTLIGIGLGLVAAGIGMVRMLSAVFDQAAESNSEETTR